MLRMTLNENVDLINDVLFNFKTTWAKRKVKATLGVHDLGNACNIFQGLI